MDEELEQLINDILVIEMGYAYEQRGAKTQRQAKVFKKVDDFLKNYLEEDNAPDQS